MGGVDKCLTLKEERAMKRNAVASSYALKVQSTFNDVFMVMIVLTLTAAVA